MVEAVGLHARLQGNKLLVFSEVVALALDQSTFNCHQDMLWELSGHLPPKDRTIPQTNLDDIAETHPDSQVVGHEEHTVLFAHYLLYGEPEKTSELSSLLFDWHEKSVALWLKPRGQSELEEWGVRGPGLTGSVCIAFRPLGDWL